ncbi:hypothetical protein EZY14_002415 [Kordia sp. TARA_039_SRF]|jgi:hypothetical protein|nr:hypothetical protein EZY14_002415 [Kordia sp. TARA_039_SRF]
MKKRNAKSLRLNKNSVSNLEKNQVNGGTVYTKYNCDTFAGSPCTSFIDACPSAWVCPLTENPRECPFPY